MRFQSIFILMYMWIPRVVTMAELVVPLLIMATLCVADFLPEWGIVTTGFFAVIGYRPHDGGVVAVLWDATCTTRILEGASNPTAAAVAMALRTVDNQDILWICESGCPSLVSLPRIPGVVRNLTKVPMGGKSEMDLVQLAYGGPGAIQNGQNCFRIGTNPPEALLRSALLYMAPMVPIGEYRGILTSQERQCTVIMDTQRVTLLCPDFVGDGAQVRQYMLANGDFYEQVLDWDAERLAVRRQQRDAPLLLSAVFKIWQKGGFAPRAPIAWYAM